MKLAQIRKLASSVRMLDWLLVSVALLAVIWVVAPQQLPVSLYKLSLLALAAYVGYRIDRSLFPYARPDRFIPTSIGVESGSQAVAFAASMQRRAIIVGCAMLAVGLGA